MGDFNYGGFFGGLGADAPEIYTPPQQDYAPLIPYTQPDVSYYYPKQTGLLSTPSPQQPAAPGYEFSQNVQQNIASDPLMMYMADTAAAFDYIPDTPATKGAPATTQGEDGESGNWLSNTLGWFKQSIGWQDATTENPKPDNSLQLALLNMGGSAIAGGLTNLVSSRKAQTDADLARYNAETNRAQVDSNIAAQEIINQEKIKEMNKLQSYYNYKPKKRTPTTGKIKFN